MKWATKNVGASSPSDYGDYFAWGETQTKSTYDWDTCFDCLDGTYDGRWGIYKIGGKTRITPSSGHDTARENWGSTWRMPTIAELEELCNKCTWTWTSQGRHKGYKVTGPNGNSIFLPAAGWRYGTDRYKVGEYGYYWSSTLNSLYSNYARYLGFIGYHNTGSRGRLHGLSVRPVTD
ncbi:MAG: fibrobacter succinogenes major paralogous domain-containing protein [Prevotella sp.]|nr:fibrobacter succinogenes major paralogous domain-containing protein [Prevotella sp.]